MGPFPHDAAPPAISAANPMGTDGFEFVEYAHPEPEKLGALFETMGFTKVARHRSKQVTLYRQGDVNFVVNAEPDSFAQAFAAAHGPAPARWPSASSMRSMPSSGPCRSAPSPMKRDRTGRARDPAVRGIGGSLLYFVDRYGEKGSIWDVDFEWIGERDPHPEQAGLYYLDHLTHNVMRGAWTIGPTGTATCSISARSASSTSRAS
jgi:4-hydroxyphenylpyruvate dioxygenase